MIYWNIIGALTTRVEASPAKKTPQPIYILVGDVTGPARTIYLKLRLRR